MFALMDCNNFYVSCERAFNPMLDNIPIVVLSNNDGCIISRSNEAKKLGIPMGAPFYQWKAFCKQHKVRSFSSNYELYGDMSQRVMTLLKEYHPTIEIYSIDEAFLNLPDNILLHDMHMLKKYVKTCTGIPISIGLGNTMTLAKLANQFAKSLDGVFHLTTSDECDHYFAMSPVEKIWGVGRKLAARLKTLNIDTALKLREADNNMLRLHFNVTLEKTIQELKGIPCLDLEEPKNRKQIISSRSFGKPVTTLNELEEAVSHYTNIAALKLRKQQSVTAAIHVFLHTNPFKEKDPQYSNGATFSFPTPTADTRLLIKMAIKCLQSIYKKGYTYRKAGIMLLDISSKQTCQYDIFLEVVDEKSERLMIALDHINKTLGRNTLYFAAEGIKRPWLIKCDHRSPRYTTRFHELPKVR